MAMAKNKYETNVKPKLGEVEKWANAGLIDEQIAKNLGISYASFNAYKVKHLELLEALKRGKAVADYEVECALFKRAIGYEYEEVTREYEDGELTKTKKTIKQVVPDTTAQIFWLKNRKPSEWRDKQDISLESGDSEVKEVKISFVDKSVPNSKEEIDPQIIGEYTNPMDIEDG